jgi:hypothetical protein
MSEVGLIGRRLFLLLNCTKKEENVSHGNTRNLFSVSVGDTSSIYLISIEAAQRVCSVIYASGQGTVGSKKEKDGIHGYMRN